MSLELTREVMAGETKIGSHHHIDGTWAMGLGIEGNKRGPKLSFGGFQYWAQLEKAESVKRVANEIRDKPGEGRIMKINRRKYVKKKSFHLRKIPWKSDFSLLWKESHSPLGDLTVPSLSSSGWWKQLNFASRQRSPMPGLMLKKGQRDIYWWFKAWPLGSLVTYITVPLETLP